MKRKFDKLALWSTLIALVIYAFTYFLYHYLGPDGSFGLVFYENPSKPVVTLLFGVWGVMFQFAGVMSWLVGRIFFGKEAKK